MKSLRGLYHKFHRQMGLRRARADFLASRDGLAIELDGRRIGFFAQLSQCLVLFHHAESTRQPIRLHLVSGNYSDADRGHDWLVYFFEWTCPPPESGTKLIRIRNRLDIGLGDVVDMTLNDANALFFSHLHVRQNILAEVNGFCSINELGAHTLGIHYRGTDKSLEASRIDYKDVIAALQTRLTERPDLTSLFVASDEGDFIAHCRQALPHVRIITYPEARPVRGGAPLHFGRRASGNYLIGKDALITSLVLSRCGEILRTTSFLSGWASVFNPALDVTLLNRPFPAKTWFPETAILKTARILGA